MALLIAVFCLGAATPPATPAPAGGMGDLTFFLGTWKCDGSFPSTGKTISSTMRFESDLGGTVIVKHHDDVPPNSYHAIETWNYDAPDAHFNAAITDNYGGIRRFLSSGWRGDVLTWTSVPDVNPLQQFVYTRLSDTSMRVDWQASRDGTNYILGDTLQCTKSTSSPGR